MERFFRFHSFSVRMRVYFFLSHFAPLSGCLPKLCAHINTLELGLHGQFTMAVVCVCMFSFAAPVSWLVFYDSPLNKSPKWHTQLAWIVADFCFDLVGSAVFVFGCVAVCLLCFGSPIEQTKNVWWHWNGSTTRHYISSLCWRLSIKTIYQSINAEHDSVTQQRIKMQSRLKLTTRNHHSNGTKL